MTNRIREVKPILAVLLLSAVVSAVAAIGWDKVVIGWVDKSIQGYSQDDYFKAIQKIRKADALIGHIHKDKRREAERLRNEGRRYLVEVEADEKDEAFLAIIRMKYYVLRDLEYGNLPSRGIASCLAEYDEKGAHLFGHQMRLEDLKVLANRGQVDASKVEKEAKEVEEIVRGLERKEQ